MPYKNPTSEQKAKAAATRKRYYQNNKEAIYIKAKERKMKNKDMTSEQLTQRRIRMRTYRDNRKEKIAKQTKEWRANYLKDHRVYHNQKKREYCLRDKQKAMNIYGGKCVGCGEKELAVLSLDHINNDGNKDRANNKHAHGNNIYRSVIKFKRDDLQCLCLNCQWRKKAYGDDITSWPNHHNSKVFSFSLIKQLKEA